jgi:hypothetical protein
MGFEDKTDIVTAAIKQIHIDYRYYQIAAKKDE